MTTTKTLILKQSGNYFRLTGHCRVKNTAFGSVLTLLLLNLLSFVQLSAATFYSGGSLPPNVRTNWWTNTNGTGVNPANFTGGDIFIIQSGHTMTTSAVWTVSNNGSEVRVNAGGALVAANNINTKKLTVNSSGSCTVNSGRTLTINNGSTAADLYVQGSLTNAGTISIAGGAVASFDSGGKYIHSRNGGTIPVATWNAASTCEISGCTTNAPNVLNQSFGNFTWNSPQTSNIQFAGALTTINGNFTVQTTGTAELRLTNNTGLTLTVAGNFILNGGIVNFASGAAATKVLNLAGNYTQAAGSTFTNSNSNVLSFNFTGTGKTFSQAGTLTNTNINWTISTGASLSLASNLPVAASRSCTVNGTLNCSALAVTGAGTFTASSGSTLQLGSPDGITASAALGNILVTGTRSYNSGANYTYTASTGSPVTGNGLPATINNFTVSTSSPNPLKLSNANLTVAGNLTVSSGAKLELGSTQQLTVAGTSALNGTDCLVLKGISGSTASFISTGAITGSYTSKVERFITSNWDWHFLSSPVTSQPMWPEFVPTPTSGSSYLTYNWATPWNWDMYYFNEDCPLTGLYWVNMRLANGNYNYNPIGNHGNFAGFGTAVPPVFEVGKGYEVAYNSGWNPATGSPQTHVFSGNLNSGTISRTITNATNAWNLVGNPYPSALDFDALYSSNSGILSSNAYYVTLGNGTYASYAVGSGGSLGASRYIAPMQGFMIVASTGGSLQFTNAMRVHNTQVWLKNGESFTNRLSLVVSNSENNLADEVLVHFDPSFNEAPGAEKLFSFTKEAPNMYTLNNARKLTINQLPSTKGTSEIPLCVVPGVNGQYTINAAGIEGFNMETSILLTDLLTGTTTDLRKSSTYTFTASTSDQPGRFLLHFGSTASADKTENAANFAISVAGRTLSIENNSGVNEFQVAVFDLSGKQQMQKSASGQLNRYELQVSSGLYIVKITSAAGITSKKLLVN